MDNTLQVDLTWLNFIVGALIPVLTGAIVKSKASSQFKAYVNLAIGAVSGALITVITNSGQLQPKEFIASIGTTLVVSWGSYNGFYKKTGITDAVQGATGNFGLGTEQTNKELVVEALEQELPTGLDEDDVMNLIGNLGLVSEQRVLDMIKESKKRPVKKAVAPVVGD